MSFAFHLPDLDERESRRGIIVPTHHTILKRDVLNNIAEVDNVKKGGGVFVN